MKIKGVWADTHRLPPEQWVNVWRLEYTGDLSYFVACQVKDVSGYREPIDELFLEPVTADGVVVKPEEAPNNVQ